VATQTVRQAESGERIHHPALRLSSVSVRLGDKLALSGIDLEVESGAFVGLIGPNGSGKSTLLRAALGVLPLASGSVSVLGGRPEQVRDRFAYLPQRGQLDLNLPLHARDVVMMGRIRHTGWLHAPGRHDREVVRHCLELVGLEDSAGSPIGALSFGQQQRVFFARALAQEGDILMLDEPMNGVDPQTQDVFVRLLSSLHDDGKTIVMATHDLTQAAAMCDNLCVLKQSLVAYGPVSEVLTEAVLRDAYGVHLHFRPGAAEPGHLLGDVHHHDGEG
jgi:ABC-type Mn2+/Zn2+ transport system ATPase subunit